MDDCLRIRVICNVLIFSITRCMILSPLYLDTSFNLLSFHFVSFEPLIPHYSLIGWYSQIFGSNANQSGCFNFIDVQNRRAFLHFYKHVDVIGPRTVKNVRETCLCSTPAMNIKSRIKVQQYDESSKYLYVNYCHI